MHCIFVYFTILLLLLLRKLFFNVRNNTQEMFGFNMEWSVLNRVLTNKGSKQKEASDWNVCQMTVQIKFVYINHVSLLFMLKCPKESKYLRSTVILSKPDLDFSWNCCKKFNALSSSLRLPRLSQRNLHKERRERSALFTSNDESTFARFQERHKYTNMHTHSLLRLRTAKEWKVDDNN